MAYFLPLCPWVHLGYEVFRLKTCQKIFPSSSDPLMHFYATLSVLPPRLPPLTLKTWFNPYPHFSSTSRKLACPSACSNIGAVLLTWPSGQAYERGYFPPKTFRTQGLATLSASCHPCPWKPLSAPHTLGLLPSKLCSSLGVTETFRSLLSTPALQRKTSRPYSCASVAYSPQKSPLLFAPRTISSGRSLFAFLGLPTSRASPSDESIQKASPLPDSPLAS